MDNELEKTAKTTETGTNQNSWNNVDALNELQMKIKAQEAEIEKLRKATTNASADASAWKKKFQETDGALKARMSDEEKAKQIQDEQTAALQTELETLRRERNIAKYTGELVDARIGMDTETARAVAEALNAGEPDKVFDGIRQFITAHDKELKANAFRNNPTLPGGGNAGNAAVTKEQFNAMSYTQRLEVFNKYPDLYREYTK